MRGALLDVSNAAVEEDTKGTRVSRASAEDAGAKGKRRADAAEPGAARGDARRLVSALMAGAEHQAEPAGTSANPDDAGYAALVGEAIGEIPESAIPKVKAVLQKTLSDVKKREDELEAKRLVRCACRRRKRASRTSLSPSANHSSNPPATHATSRPTKQMAQLSRE